MAGTNECLVVMQDEEFSEEPSGDSILSFEEASDESLEYDESQLTREGYLKDGFVVEEGK